MPLFRHKSGATMGPYEGSELARVLSQDPAWELVTAAAPPVPEPDPAGDDAPEVDCPQCGCEPGTADCQLNARKRSDLDALAESVGVEHPHGLPNKQAVVDAILAAQSR